MPRAILHNDTPMGIHRLMAEPFDYNEIFENNSETELNSVQELMQYARTGPKYNGQKVRLNLSHYNNASGANLTIDFTCINGFMVPVLPGGQELEWREYNGYLCVLVYYTCKAPGNNIKFNFSNTANTERNTYCNLHDPNVFSILDLVPLFNVDQYSLDNTNFNTQFLAEMSTNSKQEYRIFSQRFNTFPEEIASIAKSGGTGLTYKNDTNGLFDFDTTGSDIANKVYVIPKANDMNFAGSFALYVRADNFVRKGLGAV